MKTEQLKEFFENNEVSVYLFTQDKKQCAQLEVWTNGGVDMIITLQPFSKKEFISYVNDFSIDDQIDLHRTDDSYKNHFTISQSLEDFNQFHEFLKGLVKRLDCKKCQGKGWYFVNEWIGDLQGRKDCSCMLK